MFLFVEMLNEIKYGFWDIHVLSFECYINDFNKIPNRQSFEEQF